MPALLADHPTAADWQSPGRTAPRACCREWPAPAAAAGHSRPAYGCCAGTTCQATGRAQLRAHRAPATRTASDTTRSRCEVGSRANTHADPCPRLRIQRRAGQSSCAHRPQVRSTSPGMTVCPSSTGAVVAAAAHGQRHRSPAGCRRRSGRHCQPAPCPPPNRPALSRCAGDRSGRRMGF